MLRQTNFPVYDLPVMQKRLKFPTYANTRYTVQQTKQLPHHELRS